MKTGTIFIFRLARSRKGIGMSEASKLYRKLYGYNNSSYYGRYHTRVNGLLDEIKGIRLFNGAFIVRNDDAPRVEELLKKYNAEFIQKKVILDTKERKVLGV